MKYEDCYVLYSMINDIMTIIGVYDDYTIMKSHMIKYISRIIMQTNCKCLHNNDEYEIFNDTNVEKVSYAIFQKNKAMVPIMEDN